jgi:hypothetical protein
MVDDQILSALRDLHKAAKNLKGKGAQEYKLGLIEGTKSAVEICETVMRLAGKKID